jgi:hypothetical protein
LLNLPLEPERGARLLLAAMRLAGDFDESKHPRDDKGQFAGSGGEVSADDQKIIANDWAWPNSSPTGMSYERLRNPQTEEGKRMTEVLNKLPVHEGVTYRGVALSDPKDVEKLVSAKGYTLNLHSSASKDLDVALTFADAQSAGGVSSYKPFILEMHGRGRDINSRLPEDLQGTNEVVMMAGTRYKFASTRASESPTRTSC